MSQEALRYLFEFGYFVSLGFTFFYSAMELYKSPYRKPLFLVLVIFFGLTLGIEASSKFALTNQVLLNSVYDLYIPVFGLLLVFIFNFSYGTKSIRRFHIYVSLFFLLLYLTVNFLNLAGTNGVMEILIVATSVCFSSLLVFIGLILKPEVRSLKQTFIFWFGIGWLIWSTFAIFRFGGSYFIYDNNPALSKLFRLLLDLVNLITYSILAYAVLCLKHQEK